MENESGEESATQSPCQASRVQTAHVFHVLQYNTTLPGFSERWTVKLTTIFYRVGGWRKWWSSEKLAWTPPHQNSDKPNERVERAWVETPEAWISFFVSGSPFTPYQEFLPNFERLYRIQRPRKPPETRFCDLKRSNNAIIVKIVVSEVDFLVLQTNDWKNLAMQPGHSMRNPQFHCPQPL